MVQQVFRLYMKAAPERVVEFLTGFDDVKPSGSLQTPTQPIEMKNVFYHYIINQS